MVLSLGIGSCSLMNPCPQVVKPSCGVVLLHAGGITRTGLHAMKLHASYIYWLSRRKHVASVEVEYEF